MFWVFGHEVCGILAPQPGIEPAPPALEDEVLTTGPPGKSLCGVVNIFFQQQLMWQSRGAEELRGSQKRLELWSPLLAQLYVACEET